MIFSDTVYNEIIIMVLIIQPLLNFNRNIYKTNAQILHEIRIHVRALTVNINADQ